MSKRRPGQSALSYLQELGIKEFQIEQLPGGTWQACVALDPKAKEWDAYEHGATVEDALEAVIPELEKYL